MSLRRPQLEAWDETSFTSELGEAAAAWRLGPGNSKKVEKRKKKIGNEDDALPTGKKTKRRKIDNAVNWGETELEEEFDVRS